MAQNTWLVGLSIFKQAQQAYTKFLFLRKCPMSSLHWIFSLSFLPFLYNGVYWDALKLSVSDVMLVKKVPMETESYYSLGSI